MRNYNLLNETHKKKDVTYSNNIISFDFETSSIFKIKGKWQGFDNSITKEEYAKIKKGSIAYAYGFNINGSFLMGRTMTQLKKDFENISNSYATTIIYVHNLAFDFQFLLNIFDDLEVFARKPRSPIKAYSKQYNIEFRCSYVLSGYSLERYAEYFKLNVNKKVGDLDYNLVRHPTTPLTKKEIEYLKADVEIVYLMIKKELEIYKDIAHIPLTKTGKVREKVKNLYHWFDKVKMAEELYKDFETFNNLSNTFVGGYTHANSLYVGEILNNVSSYDITSSYPWSMLVFKYPRSQFTKYKINENFIEKNKDKFCIMMKVKFKNLSSKLSMSYLSYSKAINIENPLVENGRIVECDEGVWWLTNVDYEIIKYAYDFEKVEFLESYIAKSGYLPKKYRLFIYELFKNKQTMKGVEGLEDIYLLSKEQVNSLYGMTVTNTIRDEVEFFNNEWRVKPLSTMEIDSKILKSTSPSNAYINYAWGVWVTAYSRKHLWDMIRVIDYDVVYCDTDSVKFLNNHDEEFKKMNDEVHEINKKLAKDLNIDLEILGNIGEFEKEKTSKKFRTWGAKKYCSVVEKDGKEEIKITVSGLSKNASKSMSSIEEFDLKRTWGYSESGRTISNYIDDQTTIKIKDYLGNTNTVKNQKYGLCIQPTTYSLGITNEFERFVELVKNNNSTKLSQLGYSIENEILENL